MKKKFAVLILLLTLTMPGVAQASSYYMTLEGTVGSIFDGGNLAFDAGLSIGDVVNYVIEFDTERTGFTTGWNGNIKEKKGSIYSSLYSGILDGTHVRNNNFLTPYYNGFYSQASSENSGVEMNNWTSDLAGLSVGSTINSFSEYAYNKAWGYTRVNLNGITVIDISNVAPTPIPAAAFIMLGGLGIVGVIKRRFA
ncbi:VPLPA-CTERM sorting domain-containing protein [Maridesulfovibrio hydrothermalis]|uniref:VPLPA-CTERM protein sorting domain-containing protein n=1 Tax=Maridesulfovibrio hydrothermalis AM13 = DSM 14728 TaxID=1121451 RepID=L0RDS6_9BACT|nr:VPLPA-CTERM sorting domain-containing protein [Maridesulfovibrio hydrothermalis]CCO24913.1 conserved exported protein of unknown function [Maridesulfovibrio hydrothermalis AM13 = DSM 14728]